MIPILLRIPVIALGGISHNLWNAELLNNLTIFKEIIMRKLLLGTTALAAAAALSANAALADVSISGSYEFKYSSRSSNTTSLDGTTMGHGDTEMIVNFSNKTDSGLDLNFRYDIGAVTSSDQALLGDEAALSISGGFGKIVLGTDDDASDSYGIDEMDLIAEEPTSTHASASIGTSSSIGSSDAMKVAYHLPAMGGLTTGVSFADSGATGGSDKTAYGFRYGMDAAGASITLGYRATSTEASAKDIDESNMGLKIVSGDVSMIISSGKYEATDEDRDNAGASISYKMPNGMTIGAYTFKSEDDLDVGEEYTRSGVEVKYPIATGLTAYINVDDYEYKLGTNADADGADVSDSGTNSKLTIKATF